jgi:hypothetical protein
MRSMHNTLRTVVRESISPPVLAIRDVHNVQNSQPSSALFSHDWQEFDPSITCYPSQWPAVYLCTTPLAWQLWGGPYGGLGLKQARYKFWWEKMQILHFILGALYIHKKRLFASSCPSVRKSASICTVPLKRNSVKFDTGDFQKHMTRYSKFG